MKYNNQLLALMGMLLSTFASSSPVYETGSMCDGRVTVVSRTEWGARPPRTPPVNITIPVNMTFIHHSGTSWRGTNLTQCIKQIRSIQNFHMDDRGWNDIAYNYLVCEDGRVYEGRGWDTEGAQVLGYNKISIGVCIIGNYKSRLPLPAALNTTQELLACGVKKGFIKADYEMFGHRDGRLNTMCPGDRLYAYIHGWPHYSTRHIPKHVAVSSSSSSSKSVASRQFNNAFKSQDIATLTTALFKFQQL